MALFKLCKCGRKIPYSIRMCDSCEQKKQQYNKENNRHYDKYIRDKKTVDFYHSKEWEQIRVLVLTKYKGLDIYELVVNKRIVRATTIHHIIELKEDWSRRLQVDNLIPVSEATHNKIHGMYKYHRERTQEKLFDALTRAKEEVNG